MSFEVLNNRHSDHRVMIRSYGWRPTSTTRWVLTLTALATACAASRMFWAPLSSH